jgi:hypothetical protein
VDLQRVAVHDSVGTVFDRARPAEAVCTAIVGAGHSGELNRTLPNARFVLLALPPTSFGRISDGFAAART